MSNLLSELNFQKRKFDINNRADIEEYDYFLKNKKWRDLCPFRVEWPYLTVTKMIEDQIVNQFIEKATRNKKFSFDEMSKMLTQQWSCKENYE